MEVQEETIIPVTKSYLLKGLACPICSAKIEKEVEELDGVQSSALPCSAPRPMIFYCALCRFPFCPASVPKHIRTTWQSACKSRPEGLHLQKVIAHYNPCLLYTSLSPLKGLCARGVPSTPCDVTFHATSSKQTYTPKT